ncbi:hypothetical protein [Lysobacter sp. GCM10012299]|uniref:hypothetical protein n=1 Tax=Lysobacter sp. GCM10012299 TaxID=3317333 RepID=UPI00362049D7
MKTQLLVVAFVALVHVSPARADCTLAFAPPALRQAAREHYYRSHKRDATPPGQLPPAGEAASAAPFHAAETAASASSDGAVMCDLEGVGHEPYRLDVVSCCPGIRAQRLQAFHAGSDANRVDAANPGACRK